MRTLQTIRALSLLADNIENGVNELSALRVVTLRPVVTSSALTEDEVVGTEKVAEGTRANGVHGAGLQINEDSTRDVLVRADLVVVHVDPLELEVVVALVQSIRLNAVLIRDDLPELGTCYVLALERAYREQSTPLTNLVAALLDDNRSAPLRVSYDASYSPGRSADGRFHAFCNVNVSATDQEKFENHASTRF